MLGSLRAALGDIWDVPVRPAQLATADLPPAADHKGGIVFDTTTGTCKKSDGSAWDEFSETGHTHTAANITDFSEAVDDRVGQLLVDSGTLDFTYDDAGNTETAVVKDDSITFARMQNIASQKLVGRTSASSGDPEEIDIGAWTSAGVTPSQAVGRNA